MGTAPSDSPFTIPIVKPFPEWILPHNLKRFLVRKNLSLLIRPAGDEYSLHSQRLMIERRLLKGGEMNEKDCLDGFHAGIGLGVGRLSLVASPRRTWWTRRPPLLLAMRVLVEIPERT